MEHHVFVLHMLSIYALHTLQQAIALHSPFCSKPVTFFLVKAESFSTIVRSSRKSVWYEQVVISYPP